LSITTSRRARWAAASVTTLALGVAPFTAIGGAAATPGDASSARSTSSEDGGPGKGGPKAKEPVRLQILGLNDFHGQLETVPTSSSSGKVFTGPTSSDWVAAGGAAYLGSHLQMLRAKAEAAGAHSVTVAAGDLIGATPLLSAAFHDEPAIEAMNEVGLDVASVGNHEFDEGWRELLRMQRGGCLDDGAGADNQDSCPGGREFQGAEFDYLAANVHHEESGDTLLPAYEVKQYDGIKVGFIGMTLEDTPNIVTKAGVEGLQFTDEVRTVERLLPRLRREGVKSIVVLLHEGAVPNPSWQYDACPGISGPGLEIAKALPSAVDAVVSGHTHQAYNCTVDDPDGRPRLLTSASSIGRMVTEINLEINRRTGEVIRDTAAARNHIVTNADGTTAMKSIVDLIKLYNDLVAPIRDRVLGQVAPAESQNTLSRAAESNGADSPVGNLIADSQLAFDGAVPAGGEEPTIAFMNPGGIRADLVENANGDVTYGAAFNVQPFNNYVSSMTLTGAQIRAILNEQWNGRNEGASAHKILQVAGIKYTWDRTIANAQGQDAIVGDILVDHDGDGVDDVLVPTRDYRIVVNAFLGDGGDGFATFVQGRDEFIGGLDIDALADYLEAHDPYVPTPLDRISSINPLP
jgi:5'-nucleotidase